MAKRSLAVIEKAFTGLVPIDRIRAALVEMTEIDDVAEITKKIEAARKYDSETGERRNYWGELAVWSERRLGTLIKEAKADGAIRDSNQGRPPNNSEKRDTLSRLLKTDSNEEARQISSRSQRLANIPEEEVAEIIEDLKQSDEVSKAAVRRAASQRKKDRADEKKRAELRKKERAAKKEFEQQPQWDLWNMDVIEGLQSVVDHRGPARLVFADPPYNIGIDYYGDGTKADKRPSGEYLLWVDEWLGLCHDVLTVDGTIWVMISDEYAAEYKLAIDKAGFAMRSWVIWYESFGVNCSHGFNRTHRHLFYAVKDPKHFVFNEDAVRRPSDRQTKYNDLRANPAGKLLDDVWFDVPRLTGTAKQRVPDFSTQLPVELVRRIVDCCSEPGDLVVDPFSGSGTTGIASMPFRKFIGIERNEKAFDLSYRRMSLEV